MSRMSSVSVENYLKCIFHLQQASPGERVKNKDIADRLEIALPSVTSMLKALAQQEMIDYVPYQGAILTEKGEREACKILRKHRLIEVFLVQTLGLTWDEVHEEAEALEHSLSERLTERIDAYLGYPRFDPHGDPIPDVHGTMPDDHSRGRLLVTVEPGEEVAIARVLDQTPEFLRYLKDQGLTIGSAVRIKELAPFDGPITLTADGRQVSISRQLGQRILVVPR